MGKIKCTDCGLCCYLNGKPCRFLLIKKNGKSKCTIYRKRLGKDTGNGGICVSIWEDMTVYPDCPFNEEKWIKKLWRKKSNGEHDEPQRGMEPIPEMVTLKKGDLQ